LLLLVEFAHDATDRIYKAIVESAAGTPALKPILRAYDVVGSTREVSRYVKNQSLGFTIPYTLNGEEKQYYPDFIACIGDLNLIVEVSGEARRTRPRRRRRRGRSGCRRSTTTAASGSGRSSRSPIHGTRSARSARRCRVSASIQPCHDGCDMFGEQSDIRARRLVKHVHVPAQSLAFEPQVVFRRERRQGLLDAFQPRLDIVLQNVLDVFEPMVEIFETILNHHVVHARFPGKEEGGERAAILAPSRRSKACA
jgi:hypothetical protein